MPQYESYKCSNEVEVQNVLKENILYKYGISAIFKIII